MPTLINNTRGSFEFYYPSNKRARTVAVLGDDDACLFSMLPDECLVEIFRRLPGAKERSVSACVSRRWLSLLSSIPAAELPDEVDDLDIAAAEALMDFDDFELEDLDIVFTGHGGELTKCLNANEATDVRLAAMAVGTAGCGGLGSLLIRGSHPTHGVTDVGLTAIARGCPALNELSMWKVPSVTDAGLAEIAAGCPMLEKLDLSDCPLITDKGLIAVARNCPKLASLTIAGCRGIGNEGLRAIGRSCGKLQSVSIKNCPLVGDVGVSGLVTSASASLTNIKLQNLSITSTSLAVIGYYAKAVTVLCLGGLQAVDEKGFWVMGNAVGMHKLKSLFISACCGVTDRALQAIAKNCPALKQLCLRRNCYLSDLGMKDFVAEAKVLEILQLEECNRITVVGIINCLLNCKQIKCLSLVKCRGIKDIGSCPTELPVCRSLRYLTIRDCPEITSRSLAIVGKMCLLLEQIDLSGLVGITDAGLLPFIMNSETMLLKVKLSGCINLTDAVVVDLMVEHGDSLMQLHLAGCKNITDKSLVAISERCSILDDLDLSNCAITDYGVAALASARQIDMQTLVLAGCSELTEKSLPLLGNMGKSLVGLNLQRCNLISTHGISRLREKLWGCDILS